MPGKTLILLGHISAAHGIKGEVLIKTYTDAPENIAAYGPLSDAEGTRQFALQISRVTNKGVIARVDGVSDRTGAEALKGMKLCVSRDKLPEPDQDEWYYSDLIGLDVFDTDGHKLGRVVNMHNFGAGDLLELQREGAKDSDLLAFNGQTVPDVDIAAGRLTLVLPPETLGEPTYGEPTNGGPTDGKPSDAEPSDDAIEDKGE